MLYISIKYYAIKVYNLDKKSIDILQLNEQITNPNISFTEDENHLYYFCKDGISIHSIDSKYY